MRTRQRDHEETGEPQAAAGSPGDLAQMRASADRLLAAGSAAIDRALSTDSRAFLEANRQEGGQ